MEEPIYEETKSAPTGTESMEEPTYEEMKPVPTGPEIAEETICVERRAPPMCVADKIPALENYEVEYRVFANIVAAAHSRVFSGCCRYCEEIAEWQEICCLGKSYSTEDEDSSDSDDANTTSDETEEMGDSGVDTTDDMAGDVKEPPPSRAQTPEPPMGADSVKGEEELRTCVQTIFPDVWDSTIDFNVLASTVHADINPACCWRCGFITLAKEIPGLKVIEIKAETPYIFLKVTECAAGEKQKQCEESGLLQEDDCETRKSI
ncbi:uncharacterized protein LOC143843296 [Paroedura picta]|uniref:uncharacterized protein LOC143843296 n=1 Tax=Paroedura picta TaxID=143630 RepID=UPI004056B900